MSHLIRHLCIGLCVAMLAALNLHGVVESQHAVGHSANWPVVALVEGHGDHSTAHVHVVPDDATDAYQDREVDDPPPVGHHHHGGGDVHVAMPALSRDAPTALSLISALRWSGTDPAVAGLSPDGPEYPPKRMRTVV